MHTFHLLQLILMLFILGAKVQGFWKRVYNKQCSYFCRKITQTFFFSEYIAYICSLIFQCQTWNPELNIIEISICILECEIKLMSEGYFCCVLTLIMILLCFKPNGDAQKASLLFNHHNLNHSSARWTVFSKSFLLCYHAFCKDHFLFSSSCLI